jgi:chloramphenicol-sensitive protein RarD
MNKKGMVYAILAYGAWGILPLYWKLFERMTALEILAHRIIWSFVFVWILIFASRRLKDLLEAAKDGKRLLMMVLCASLITMNWLIYIYTVNSGHMVEASLGYYMNPLFNVLLGVVFLRERLSVSRWIAIVLAIIGVSIMTYTYGKFPWMAISLAVSFGFYGLVKKKVTVDSIVGLSWETMIVLPLSLIYVIVLHINGTDTVFTLPPLSMGLLLLAGIATATPLLWFGIAAKLLDLSILGFFQYLAPTITLLLGIFLYHETFTHTDFVAFSFIWVALIVFSISNLKIRSVDGSVSRSAS